MLGYLALRIGDFLRDTRGAAAMEFVVVLPGLMYIFFTFGEIGVLTGRKVLLKRGLSFAMRDVRLGLPGALSETDFKANVCANAFLLSNCEESLLVEMTPVDLSALGAPPEFKCVNSVDPTLTPLTTYTPGVPGQIMLVRACLIVKPVFPGTGIGANLSRQLGGRYAILATSGFVREQS